MKKYLYLIIIIIIINMIIYIYIFLNYLDEKLIYDFREMLPLGSGAFGHVFKYKHWTSDKYVAIKIIEIMSNF
jgi:hypothetical protein